MTEFFSWFIVISAQVIQSQAGEFQVVVFFYDEFWHLHEPVLYLFHALLILLVLHNLRLKNWVLYREAYL